MLTLNQYNTLEMKTVYYDDATVGKITYKGLLIAETLELPWKENQKRISCIPEGTYSITIEGEVIRLNEVPKRTGILIHAGNTLSDTKGCILVGQLTYDFAQKNPLKRFVTTLSKQSLQVLKIIISLNKFTHIKITRR